MEKLSMYQEEAAIVERISALVQSDSAERGKLCIDLIRSITAVGGEIGMSDSSLRTYIRAFGIQSPEIYLHAWRQSYDVLKGERNSHMTDGLMSLARLENRYPGGARILEHNYKLRAVQRYPHDLLVKQCEMAGRLDLPYGIVLTSMHDANGSFLHTKWHMADMDSFAKDAFAIRFAEFRGPKEALGLLKSIYGYYRGRPLDFLVIQEHGNPDDIYVNTPVERLLRHESLKASGGLNLLDRILADDATLVVNSCYSNEHGGYADRLEESLRRRVYRRRYNCGEAVMRPCFVEGKPTIVPIWSTSENRE